jgi:uncharacterized protein YgiM (DUF1202 family)
MPAMPPAPPQQQVHAAPPAPALQDQPAPQDQTGAMQQAAPQDQGGEWVRVSPDGANVRSGPSSSASRLATLSPGQALRVVSRQEGWVQVASPGGSETGWIYEELLEPTIASDQHGATAQGPAQPSAAEQQGQGELAQVTSPSATVRGGPSDDSGMLFGLPQGRELRVLSRHSGWVLIEDRGSKQVGWIAEGSLASAEDDQQQAAAPQRANRMAPDNATETTDAEDAWVLGEENISPPDEMVEPPRQPRKWGQRGGRLAGVLRRALRAF